MNKEIEKLKSIEARVRDIEEWQLRLERPRDEDTGELVDLSLFKHSLLILDQDLHLSVSSSRDSHRVQIPLKK